MKLVWAFIAFAVMALATGGPDWKVSMEPVGKIKANYPAQVNVKILDSKKTPVEGAAVEVVLTMEEMDHGEFKSAAKMSKPGVYEVKPTFFMVGKWRVTVHSKKGDQSRTDVFPYEVTE
jgi:nitrogen fixation protein FixH